MTVCADAMVRKAIVSLIVSFFATSKKSRFSRSYFLRLQNILQILFILSFRSIQLTFIAKSREGRQRSKKINARASKLLQWKSSCATLFHLIHESHAQLID